LLRYNYSSTARQEQHGKLSKWQGLAFALQSKHKEHPIWYAAYKQQAEGYFYKQ
jgi:hypothetical protein